jgi:cysteine desulfurase/selenocysteine lyase
MMTLMMNSKIGIDINGIRENFPILKRQVHPGKQLIYLDSAATSQKPSEVIQAMDVYYSKSNANIHRGVHTLAEEATLLYETARENIADFIHAPSSKQIIYTRNTTESINLVAQTWGRKNLKPDDVILLTEMEHHSNLVPWQILAQEKNIRLEFIPITGDGQLDLDEFGNLLRLEPKIVAFTHMSNVLGTINPAKKIIQMSHEAGAVTLLDGAQSVPHFPVDVQDLNADFLAFSAHKMCGPTGIGVLYGRKNLLEEMPPFLGGGDMIKRVYLRSFTSNELPYKFEAGTPAIAEAVGFGEAVSFLRKVGMAEIELHERSLTSYALDRLSEVPFVSVYGPQADKKGGVVSLSMDGIHPHDIAQILDQDGIAVRAGHHCAMPLHEKLNLPATTRASFYLYNTNSEIDLFVEALYKVYKIFGM